MVKSYFFIINNYSEKNSIVNNIYMKSYNAD